MECRETGCDSQISALESFHIVHLVANWLMRISTCRTMDAIVALSIVQQLKILKVISPINVLY